MQDQSADQNFDSEDFQEAPSMPRQKGYPPLVVAVGGALFGLILAVILIRGSMPEMTPEQIVAMEGYQGEQPPRYIFNLDSLGTAKFDNRASTEPLQGASRVSTHVNLESGTIGNHSRTNDLVAVGESVRATGDSATRVSANSNPGVVSGPNSEAINALLAIETEEPKDTWPLEIVEVPASPIIVGKDAQEVAAPIVEEFDYRKLNRRSGLPTQNTHADTAHGQMAVQKDQGESTSKIRVLPVFTVSTDSAYVRAEPTQLSDIKLVLARGTSVTAFEQAGAWVHVGANDGSSITGYVHHSKIAVTEIN